MIQESNIIVGAWNILICSLSSNLGHKLKTLVLNCYKTPPTSTIFSQMKDLPVLEKLHLYFPRMTINTLEMINQNIPSIKDLSLMQIQFKGGVIPPDVAPVTSLTRLRFDPKYYDNVGTHAQVYQYMTKKHTNLKKINYEDEVLFSYTQDERKQVYEGSLVHFLKFIASFSTKLPLFGLPDGLTIFDSLDRVDSIGDHLILQGCNDNKLLEYLSRSNHAKSIETLGIVNSNHESTLIISLHRSRYNMGCLDDCLLHKEHAL